MTSTTSDTTEVRAREAGVWISANAVSNSRRASTSRPAAASSVPRVLCAAADRGAKKTARALSRHAELRESPVAPDAGAGVVCRRIAWVKSRRGREVVERSVHDAQAPIFFGDGAVTLRRRIEVEREQGSRERGGPATRSCRRSWPATSSGLVPAAPQHAAASSSPTGTQRAPSQQSPTAPTASGAAPGRSVHAVQSRADPCDPRLFFAAQTATPTRRVRNDENGEDHEQNECCTVHRASSYEMDPRRADAPALHQRAEDPDDDWAETDDVECRHQT